MGRKCRNGVAAFRNVVPAQLRYCICMCVSGIYAYACVWLDVPQRLQYKLGVTMHRCLQHKAPRYLVDCCTPVAEVPGRRHLRSANRHQLLVPRYRRSALGPRAFSVAGPRAWNALPDVLRDPTHSSDSFRSTLKTFLFAEH